MLVTMNSVSNERHPGSLQGKTDANSRFSNIAGWSMGHLLSCLVNTLQTWHGRSGPRVPLQISPTCIRNELRCVSFQLISKDDRIQIG